MRQPTLPEVPSSMLFHRRPPCDDELASEIHVMRIVTEGGLCSQVRGPRPFSRSHRPPWRSFLFNAQNSNSGPTRSPRWPLRQGPLRRCGSSLACSPSCVCVLLQPPTQGPNGKLGTRAAGRLEQIEQAQLQLREVHCHLLPPGTGAPKPSAQQPVIGPCETRPRLGSVCVFLVFPRGSSIPVVSAAGCRSRVGGRLWAS
ncbi:hypothetical protein B0I37DRAFT_170542 [Chaetomium sp. MPI-CAGE-AT-0009]|nr:hypothetical protein B0I37DRAFT_170542 [Chaetomium sp. MPI-CAGE-AT-0009]